MVLFKIASNINLKNNVKRSSNQAQTFILLRSIKLKNDHINQSINPHQTIKNQLTRIKNHNKWQGNHVIIIVHAIQR